MNFLYVLLYIIQAATLLLGQSFKTRTEVCSLSSEIGQCKEYIPSWFYNTRNAKCEKFIYGGCGGNANRFSTYENCEQYCGPLSEAEI